MIKKIISFFLIFCAVDMFAMPAMKLIPQGKYFIEETQIVQKAFYMSETKVTIADWKEYIEETEKSSWKSVYERLHSCADEFNYEPDDSCPVYGLKYVELVDYCNWLSEKQNLEKCYKKTLKDGMVVVETDYNANGYRLPVLREWYYVSELWMKKNKSYYEKKNILNGGKDLSRGYPYSVKDEVFNSFGIKDPLGNIYEYCNDFYFEGQNFNLMKTNEYGPVEYTKDPDQLYFHEPLTAVRINAGGCFNSDFESVQKKFIFEINELSSEFVGFRIVRMK